MSLILILYICVIGRVLWFLYIYQRDVFEPEPLAKVLKAIVWGAIPAVILSILLGSFVFFWAGLLNAPIVEEACKGIYVYRMRKDPELEGPMDGLVYGASVAIGFEVVENILYSFSKSFGLEVSIIRSITVGHILYTGLFGLMVGLAKIKGKNSLILYGYVGAVLLHLTWNGLATINWISFLILLPIFIFILKKLLDVAWKYELEAYISPLEDIKKRARMFIGQRGGTSTAELADELGIKPHRTVLVMKNIGARLDRKHKKWHFVSN
jgi:RsiW-degrading membrane proteinase PrsW (M82 family)